MRYIIFKENCRFKRWTPALGYMLDTLHELQQNPTMPQIVVTSVNDSGHSKSPISRHYTDEALDIRTHNFTDLMQKKTFINQYLTLLNTSPKAKKLNCFTVIFENPTMPEEHIHVQVKMGMSYDS